jgi:hypothetical protein
MSEWFHVGQKVVCVKRGPWRNAAGWAGDGRIHFPLSGAVYTVRGLDKRPNGVSLLLEEITNPPMFAGFEPSFDADRFRPLRKRTTDISAFKALLNTSDEKVNA